MGSQVFKCVYQITIKFRGDNDFPYSIQSSMSGNGENRGDNEVKLNYSAIENDYERTRSEIHGQTNGESDTQLRNDGDKHEEYGMNRLNFDTTEKRD